MDNPITETSAAMDISMAEKVKILIDRTPSMSAAKLSRMLGYSKQNIATKIQRNSLRSEDIEKIADILGYEVVFVKK